MSYCRWSSMNWQCDVYCYESAQGFECHVASRRREPIDGACPTVDWGQDIETIREQYDMQNAWLNDDSNWKWVDLPDQFAGNTYTTETPGELAEILVDLKTHGLNVPQYAIDDLREEQADVQKAD